MAITQVMKLLMKILKKNINRFGFMEKLMGKKYMSTFATLKNRQKGNLKRKKKMSIYMITNSLRN